MFQDVLGKTFRLLGYTIQYGCIAHCAFEYVGGIVVCSGPSMQPTIQNYDIVVLDNLSRHFYSIQKGDIVIAKSPSDPKSNICKRVIGLEGDKVCTSSPSNFLKSHSYDPFLNINGKSQPSAPRQEIQGSEKPTQKKSRLARPEAARGSQKWSLTDQYTYCYPSNNSVIVLSVLF
ncbi:mitochondrial inner membrane protease subunit 1 isoform X1 [Alligator sinensis]|uniref:Mitochondrial inner membrane protease subunit n=1 Tax=Alligator sinensis TaxID=38654 RepID=A0A3Q0HAN3_ALLSI|nr:mitochondrial inner membrane protease subunit 1 isoform X1 [Alligator sinensis]XP_025069131.1 mitochondrial inner membrane protease subunit 1 isoform X1 [Alligator sinensis]